MDRNNVYHPEVGTCTDATDVKTLKERLTKFKYKKLKTFVNGRKNNCFYSRQVMKCENSKKKPNSSHNLKMLQLKFVLIVLAKSSNLCIDVFLVQNLNFNDFFSEVLQIANKNAHVDSLYTAY